MAKAINWPIAFRQAVVDEPTDKIVAAVRPGRLYFDNQYWVDGEIVDIRVNHKIIRKAVIVGELGCMRIRDLSRDELAQLKAPLNDRNTLAQFLTETYNEPVTLDSEVTIVHYRNQPLDPEIMEVEDDPHMVGS